MKKILCTLLALLLVIVGINKLNAEYAYDTSKLENYITSRNEDNKFGINKKWIKTENNTKNIMQTPYVDSSLKIYDFAGILKEEEITELKTQIDTFKNLTNMEIVILTIDMPYSYDSKNEEVAADFYDYNDFGINTKQYDGVLFLRNNYSSDRYFNIYTFGEAQLYFDYDRCEEILDHIYPSVRMEQYLYGFSAFISDLTSFYNQGKALGSGYTLDENGFVIETFTIPWIPALVIATIVSCISIVVMVKKNKMIKKAYEANDYLIEDSISYRKKSQHLVSSHTTHYTISSSSGGGGGHGGGGHSHSGSSGGGHGGGGGRHG